MPELPEVEVTRRRIEGLLVGRRISRVLTTENSYFFLTDPRRLRQRLVGREFTWLERHGKYLVAGLDDDRRLLLHLGMSGQLFAEEAASPRLRGQPRLHRLGPGPPQGRHASAYSARVSNFQFHGPASLAHGTRRRIVKLSH